MNSNSAWRERQRMVLACGAQRDHDPAFGPVYVRGQSARLWDSNGRDYIDLTCGFSASNFGHAFAPLVDVAVQQLNELTHLTGAMNTRTIRLAERLLETVCPATTRPNKVLFNTTGARAIETAWKASVAFRPGKLLTLAPGFHGRSIATAAISSTVAIGPRPVEASFQVAPAENYPYCARCPLGLQFPSCNIACSQDLFRQLEEQPEQFSAILVEPALGARGYVFPPPAFFQRLRELTRRAGVLMIADEIQSGLGRCGDWLLSRHQGWEADLVVIGKSLGGGIVPISAVVGRADVLDAIPAGAESETFAASPFASRIALQVLHELQTGPWIERGRAVGKELRNWFATLANPENGIQSVDGYGANCVLEFTAADGEARKATAKEQSAALDYARRLHASGLLVHHTGPQQTRIVLLPPLTIRDDELADVKHRSLRCSN